MSDDVIQKLRNAPRRPDCKHGNRPKSCLECDIEELEAENTASMAEIANLRADNRRDAAEIALLRYENEKLYALVSLLSKKVVRLKLNATNNLKEESDE